MNKIALFLLAISSVIFGSSLSLIFSNIVSQMIPLEFFSRSIPGISNQLIHSKTFDLIDFFLTVLFSLLIFFINFFILNLIKKERVNTSFHFTTVVLLFLSFFIFMQTRFVTYSKTHILGLIFLFEIIFFALSYVKKQTYEETISSLKTQKPELLFLTFSNGLLLGFYLLLILNQLTAVVMIPLMVFTIAPLFFLAAVGIRKGSSISKAAYSFPGLIVLFSIFFPVDLAKILLLGLPLFAIWFILFVFKSDFLVKPFFTKFICPAAVVFVFVYNPTFYIGNFDSVEEGFFLGWLQRLIQGNVLYKDAAVFHPPLLIWGMFFWSKITGFSIFSERLFIHLLQVTGSIIYFFYLRKFVTKAWVIILALILFLSFSSTLVRNNIEIRLGVGLLSLLLLFNFLQTKKQLWILLSGISGAVTVFTSLEIGLAAIFVLFITLNLFPADKFISLRQLKINLAFLIGLTIGSLPILLTILLQGGLAGFFEQLTFYSQAFSKGYFNVPIERAISLSFFHWHIFNQYLSSNAMFWEISRLTLISTIIYLFAKWLIEKSINTQEKFLFTTALFGLVLFRFALGRSDYYHLLFVLSISLVVLGYFLEKLSSFRPIITAVLSFALLFFFARPAVNSVFLENQLYKFQTYGKVLGDYKKYSFPRGSGVLVGTEIDTKAIDDLIDFIHSSTDPDGTIFVYPWMPEIYFFADRRNATFFDTPYAFFSEKYQQEMISELRGKNPKLVIYNRNKNFGGLTPDSLPLVNKFILENYEPVTDYGSEQVLKVKLP